MKKVSAILSLLIGIFVVMDLALYLNLLPVMVVLVLAIIGLVLGGISFRKYMIPSIMGVILNLYTLMFLGMVLTA